MEKIRLLNNACKGYLKTWISEIAKASRDIAPGPHKGGSQCPIWTAICNDHADACWVDYGPQP